MMLSFLECPGSNSSESHAFGTLEASKVRPVSRRDLTHIRELQVA
jgi:hypothetical protein